MSDADKIQALERQTQLLQKQLQEQSEMMRRQSELMQQQLKEVKDELARTRGKTEKVEASSQKVEAKAAASSLPAAPPRQSAKSPIFKAPPPAEQRVKVTLGGFVTADTVWRQRNMVADMGTPFNAIPFPFSPLYDEHEFHGSARESRISLLIEGKIDPWQEVAGYFETDFLGVGGSTAAVTVIMGLLSRWSGGLLDRIGARLPLIIGPMITGVGFTLIALAGPTTSYWIGFLLPTAIVGLGMAITVAPLTTTVINAVPAHQTGVASGINNSVASVATLLAIAIFGAVGLSSFNRALDQHLATPSLSSSARKAIESARGRFVIDSSLTTALGADRSAVEAIIKASLAQGIRMAMLLAAALALVSAACAALTIRPVGGRPIPGEASS